MGYPTHTPQSVDGAEYDYIVVGGGTAGCVVASRLSEDEKVRVLVLERGPVVNSWTSHVPLISSNFTDKKAPTYRWQSTPQRHLEDREIGMASGKALGGSSLVNALLYTRSIPAEFNNWAAQGRQGWRWEDVEPVFKRSEKFMTDAKVNYRGSKGPWQTQVIDQLHFPQVERSVLAAAELGVASVPTANDPKAPAVACVRLDSTIDKKGKRNSTFDAFLSPAIANARRANLHICTGAVVCKVEVKDEGGVPRATGVVFEDDTPGPSGAKRYQAKAKAAVVLCAGAIATPQVLMLSGIGPADHLRSHGIEVVKDIPGVGAHLQDHLSVPLLFNVPISQSVEGLVASKFRAGIEFLKYVITHKGLLGSQVQQADMFILSRLLDSSSRTVTRDSWADMDATNPNNIPDIECMFLPVDPNPPSPTSTSSAKPKHGTFSYLCAALRPASAGSVRLASADPRARPACDLGFLSAPEDHVVLRKALKLGLALRTHVNANASAETGELEDRLVPVSESDEDLDAFARKYVTTTYHYSSTCRMKPFPEGGVVDDELRVHGVRGLSIADASVFPTVPACHLQAPVVMVAERCSDFLRKATGAEVAATGVTGTPPPPTT